MVGFLAASRGEAMKRAAIYLRVSTQDQTTSNQEHALRQTAERAGWQVARVYKDHGISGAKGRNRRPAFDALCRDATTRQFDVVMAWNVSSSALMFSRSAYSPGTPRSDRSTRLPDKTPFSRTGGNCRGKLAGGKGLLSDLFCLADKRLNRHLSTSRAALLQLSHAL